MYQVPVIWQALAETFLDIEDHPRALAAARNAVELAPLDADCHAVLAWSAYYTGDATEGLDAAKKALTLDPVHADATWIAILLRVQRHDLPAAHEALTHALRVKEGLPRFLGKVVVSRLEKALTLLPAGRRQSLDRRARA